MLETAEHDRRVVVSKLGLNGLPPSEQDTVILELEKAILSRVTEIFVTLLSGSDKDQFLKLLDTGTIEEVVLFLDAKIPDARNKIREIAVDMAVNYRHRRR